MVAVVIEADLEYQRPVREGLARVLDPVRISDESVVAIVSGALLQDVSVPYVHYLTVPERPVLLIDANGAVVKAFLYTVGGSHNLFIEVPGRLIGGDYYYGSPFDMEHSPLEPDDPRGRGFASGRQVQGFSRLVSRWVDVYAGRRERAGAD